jgi:hypothetical protein
LSAELVMPKLQQSGGSGNGHGATSRLGGNEIDRDAGSTYGPALMDRSPRRAAK